MTDGSRTEPTRTFPPGLNPPGLYHPGLNPPGQFYGSNLPKTGQVLTLTGTGLNPNRDGS